jgi:hypothetical protein
MNNKRTVAEVIAFLQKFPPDAYAYAYSGESTGIVVVDTKIEWPNELGFMETDEC